MTTPQRDVITILEEVADNTSGGGGGGGGGGGDASAAKQDTGNASLASIDGKIPASPATAGNQTSANTKLDTLHTDLGTTLHADIGSTNTKLDTLHTDLGTTIHADLGKLADGTQKTQIVDSAGTHTQPAGDAASRPVFVEISDGTSAVTVATAALQTSANTKLDTLHTDLGTLATSAAQTTAATKLDTLHTDLGALTDGTQKVKTALPTGTHAGANLAVGTSSANFASQATTIGLAIFSAPIANTVAIYLARNTSVTASTGIELLPGDSIPLPCANTNEYYAISGSASQNCRVLAI